MKEKRNRKGLVAVCLLVLSLVLITVGTTFALFQYSRQGTTENKIETGTLTFVYDESKSKDGGVSIDNAFPMSDTEGEKLDSSKNGVFDFDVRAKTQGAPINYEIYLTKEKSSTLPEYVVKTYLKTVSGDIESEITGDGLPTETNLNLYSSLYDSKVPELLKDSSVLKAKTLYRETISDEQSDYTKTFRYRMWIDNEANQVVNGSWKYNDMTFSVKVNVYAQNGTISEPIQPKYIDQSGANLPDLVEGLIPVTYSEEQQSWIKADLYKEWYDYNKQEWANAVTVYETMAENGSHDRQFYLEAEPGTAIDIDDINTMWVWIPRYEYNYVNIQEAGGQQEMCTNRSVSWKCYKDPGAIEINFVSGQSTDNTVNYILHPAFTFGEDQLDGFWYGKFETSSKEKCVAANYSVNTACDIETLIPQIKPSITSWRGMRVSTAFTVSQKMMNDYATEYGFGEGIDTHMSKNSEWGAVAYLSQSAYGKYHVDKQEVAINSCNNYMTGVAGCSDNYTSTNGLKTSTTGNVTGVYDMNGGAWEYVMGALTDESNKPRSGQNASYNSGFNGVLYDGGSVSNGRELPDPKYYDLYTSTASASACDERVCYGHALSETEGWYSDYKDFISSMYPWFQRGGWSNGSLGAGVFTSSATYGNAYDNDSFRVVLAPIK